MVVSSRGAIGGPRFTSDSGRFGNSIHKESSGSIPYSEALAKPFDAQRNLDLLVLFADSNMVMSLTKDFLL